MPGFDGTGPQGRGPMTGGGRGLCVVPAPFDGLVPDRRAELAHLRAEARRLERALDDIRAQVGALENARQRRQQET